MRDQQLPPLKSVLYALFSGRDPAALWSNSASSLANAPVKPFASSVYRVFGLEVEGAYRARLLGLLGFAYKCRLCLPLFISAGFFLFHLISKNVLRVEIEVVPDPDVEVRADIGASDDEEEDEENSEEEEVY